MLQDPHGKPGCDFFGLNHYARCSPPPWNALFAGQEIQWLLRSCMLRATGCA